MLCRSAKSLTYRVAFCSRLRDSGPRAPPAYAAQDPPVDGVASVSGLDRFALEFNPLASQHVILPAPLQAAAYCQAQHGAAKGGDLLTPGCVPILLKCLQCGALMPSEPTPCKVSKRLMSLSPADRPTLTFDPGGAPGVQHCEGMDRVNRLWAS